MVQRDEEGRGKLRKFTVRCKRPLQPWVSEWVNLDGLISICCSAYAGRGKRGELKHLSNRRKRKRSDFLSSGERNGKSLNRCYVIDCRRCSIGVVGTIGVMRQNGHRVTKYIYRRTVLERRTVGGESPVFEIDIPLL